MVLNLGRIHRLFLFQLQLHHLGKFKFQNQLSRRNPSVWFWKISKAKKHMLISAIKVWNWSQIVLLCWMDSKQHQAIRLGYFGKEIQVEFGLGQKLVCHPRNVQESCWAISSHVQFNYWVIVSCKFCNFTYRNVDIKKGYNVTIFGS